MLPSYRVIVLPPQENLEGAKTLYMRASFMISFSIFVDMEKREQFMLEAIEMADNNVRNGGGPFAALIVRGDQIVGRGINRVTANNDPTAHGEVTAIRDACANLKTYDLSDCDIYTSCEPCPMCLGAIYWAHIRHIYYGNTQQDAAEINFDDSHIYRQIERPIGDRAIPETRLCSERAKGTFRLWSDKTDKILY